MVWLPQLPDKRRAAQIPLGGIHEEVFDLNVQRMVRLSENQAPDYQRAARIACGGRAHLINEPAAV
jgi:hypothetical protein